MPLTDLVASNAVIPALKASNKKQAIQELAARAAVLCGESEPAIREILLQREKLGSTAVGNGVAIPHGKLPKLTRLFGLFARLEQPIGFEALDGQPVDLCSCCWRPRTPAPIISRRWRAWRGCCAIRRWRRSCGTRAAPMRFMRRWRCRRPRPDRNSGPQKNSGSPAWRSGIGIIRIQRPELSVSRSGGWFPSHALARVPVSAR